jgi:hypothetical protein
MSPLMKLKKIIEKEGMPKVASDLGYRSNTTITNWINKKKIPKVAVAKVEKYLSTKGENL